MGGKKNLFSTRTVTSTRNVKLIKQRVSAFCLYLTGEKTQKPPNKPSAFCEILLVKQINKLCASALSFSRGLRHPPSSSAEQAGWQDCTEGCHSSLPFPGLYLKCKNLPDTYSILLFPASVIQAVLLLLFSLSVFPDGF